MKSIFIFNLFLILLILFSCEELRLGGDCIDCTEDEPVTTFLDIRLHPEYRGGIVVKIYEGNLNDSLLCYSFTNYTASFKQKVGVNKKYTITAAYRRDNIKYIVVNEIIPKIKYTKVRCDKPCFYVYDNIVDLELKYGN